MFRYRIMNESISDNDLMRQITASKATVIKMRFNRKQQRILYVLGQVSFTPWANAVAI